MFKQCFRYSHATLLWLFVVFLFLVHSILGGFLFIISFGKSHKYRFLAKPFIRWVLFLGGIRLCVEGEENLSSQRPLVIASNHQSMLDIMLFLMVLPMPFFFLAKSELKWVPIVGWEMVLQGHVFVKRQSARHAYQAVTTVMKKIRSGWSLLVFPEGTRSPDGTISAFKRGSFKSAVETGTDILPCRILGARDCLPKQSLIPNFGTVRLVIGPIISVKSCEGLDKRQKKQMGADLAEQTRAVILSLG